MPQIRSLFRYHIAQNIIFIEDLDGDKSVTNDIENVLADITSHLRTSLDNFRLLYRDSMGIIDGIRTYGGSFKEFYPIQEQSLRVAKTKIKI